MIRVLTLLFALTGASPARAGGMTSSGGELIVSEDNPWFVGTRPVSYCIEHDAAFSVSKAAARDEIAAALYDWTFALDTLQPTATKTAFADGEHKSLTLRFDEEPCGAATELRFLLGTATASVGEALRHHARFTLALALHSGIDETTGRALGAQIWLVPDSGERAYAGPNGGVARIWSRPDALRGVLMHELGHLFGLPHMDGGFLRRSFPADVVLGRAAGDVTAQVVVEQSWLALERPACGRVTEGPSDVVRPLGLGERRATTRPGDRVCFVPVRGDDAFDVHLVDAASLADMPGAAQGPRPEPLGWPEAHGVAVDAQMVAGAYVDYDGRGVPTYWEQDFVAIPRLLRLRGTLVTATARLPLLLEQRGATFEMIVPHRRGFAIFRVELGR